MRSIRAATLVLALAASPLSHAAQIVVGQVAPLSGLEANQGRAYGAGMQMYFNSINGTAAAHGHTFTLARRDDGGRPEDTLAGTRKLLAEDKPLVLAGYFGNRNINGIVGAGLLEKERIALVGYRTAEVRADSPWVYNVRAGLREELNKIAEHLATIGITKLALLYEQGPGSTALLAAADDAAARNRTQFVARSGYPAGTASVAASVDAMMKAEPQAILMVTSGAAAAAFIEQYRASGGAALMFAHSGADIEQMSKRLSEEQMQGVAIAQVTPSPYRIASPLAKEFADLVARNPKLEVPVSYTMMEGFIAGKVIAEAVRRQGARPTREGIVSVLDGMDRYDAGGYVVGFKGGHTGSRFVELSIISSTGRIRQ